MLAQTYKDARKSSSLAVDEDAADEHEHTSRRNTSEALAQLGV